MLWAVLFDAIHHRGQLSLYIRLTGGKVPAIYGPSADEASAPMRPPGPVNNPLAANINITAHPKSSGLNITVSSSPTIR